ncbi:MAG: hypothetical protein ABSE56_20960 [Bryobacteraceae bacterium]
MERAICEQCGHSQPREWVAGQLCVACGAAVRREVRCAWCAEWIPAGRFCRTCGCDVLGPEQYGPARMLKSAGVDLFSIAQRLRELDPEQAANLGRIYNAQLAVVTRRVEELRLCENYLLQKGFSKRLDDELVPQLPMEKAALAAIAEGPEGPFDASQETLVEIASRSPIPLTRTLASIALVRLGQFKGFYDAVCEALSSSDRELALEAALVFPHWRMRVSPYDLWHGDSAYTFGSIKGIDRRQLAAVAGAVPQGSVLRPWAAAAATLAWSGEYEIVPEPGEFRDPGPPEWLRAELSAGLSARDPDLRFTCAMALGEDGIVARALDSGDAQQRLVARTFLAKRKSPAIAPLLIEGPEEIREEILKYLRSPLPDALVEPVVQAVERCDAKSRARGARLLRPSLTVGIVERLIRLGRKESDAEVFKILLEAEELPAGREVVRAVIEAGFLETLWGKLYDNPQHVDFTDPEVLKFAAKGDASVLEKLVNVAGRQTERGRGSEGGVVPFLVRIAFGDAPAEVRCDAYGVLDRYDPERWDWLSPASLRKLFGGAAGFLEATAPVLQEAELARICSSVLEKLTGRWAELAEVLTEDRAAVRQFANALRQAASSDPRWRAESAKLLVKMAVSCPGEALPAVSRLLRECGLQWGCWDIPGDLLAEYSALAGRMRGEEALAEELASALAAMLSEVTFEERYVPAIELLTRLAEDHPALRKGIAAGTASIIEDREWCDRDLKPPLDELAKAVGSEEKREEEAETAPAPPEKPPQAPPIAPEVWDHLVMLPEAPVKTLAQYVAFLKAMNTTKEPMAVIASYGMTVESFGECVSQWGEVIAGNDALAIRYGQLVSGM